MAKTTVAGWVLSGRSGAPNQVVNIGRLPHLAVGRFRELSSLRVSPQAATDFHLSDLEKIKKGARSAN
jgi:hypothetical protein